MKVHITVYATELVRPKPCAPLETMERMFYYSIIVPVA